MGQGQGYNQQTYGHPSASVGYGCAGTGQSQLPNPYKQESKFMPLQQSPIVSYDPYSRGLLGHHPSSAGVQNHHHGLLSSPSPGPPFNGHMFSVHSPPNRGGGSGLNGGGGGGAGGGNSARLLMGSSLRDRVQSSAEIRSGVLQSTKSQHHHHHQHEMEEINTRDLAQKISSELKRYSIPQAVFAQRVLCRSQGTLSDLLRNPKPWSKLKSGRETFRRMWKWLQEPEFQRMSALRLAGKLTGK